MAGRLHHRQPPVGSSSSPASPSAAPSRTARDTRSLLIARYRPVFSRPLHRKSCSCVVGLPSTLLNLRRLRRSRRHHLNLPSRNVNSKPGTLTHAKSFSSTHHRLGQMGDVVSLRDGYARNFLLPQEEGAARHGRRTASASRKTGAPSSRPATSSSRREAEASRRQAPAARPSSPSARPATPASSAGSVILA